jgi:hypothetical protein
MTDQQLLTLALAVVIPLSLLIYSNSRITEAKETLRAETAKLGTELRAEIAAVRHELELLRRDMNAGFERIENALKVHVLEHHK